MTNFQNDFAEVATTVLPLAGVDRWVEVKTALSVGEQKKLESLPIGKMSNSTGEVKDNEIGIDWSNYYLGKLFIYIVDWSLRGADGKKVPVSRPNIAGLKPATADEITAALDAYLDERDKLEGKVPSPTTNATPSESVATVITAIPSTDATSLPSESV